VKPRRYKGPKVSTCEDIQEISRGVFRVRNTRVALPTISAQLYERKIQDKGNDNDRHFSGNVLEAIRRQATTNAYGEPKERFQDPMALVGGGPGIEG
jgi:hypothetical protein